MSSNSLTNCRESLVIKKDPSRSIPSGIYDATVIELTATEHPQYGAGVVWTFEVEHRGDRAHVTGITSRKLNPKTKMWSWIKAFKIDPLSGPEDFNLKCLIGKKIRIKVEKSVKREQQFSNVSELIPRPGIYIKWNIDEDPCDETQNNWDQNVPFDDDPTTLAAELSNAEMLQPKAIEILNDIGRELPVTNENVKNQVEVAQLNSETKSQNSITLTFDTAKDAISNCLDNMFPPEKVSDASLDTLSTGTKEYRWTIIDNNGRKLALLLTDHYPSLSVERFAISTVASLSLTPESQQDGPMCYDYIYAKHQTLDHLCDVVSVLLQVACYSAKVYEENDIRYDKSWFPTADQEVTS